MKLADNPLLLLLGTGFGIGLNFPMGKLAAQAGIGPPMWAFVTAMGAGTVLFLASLALDRGMKLNRVMLVYCAIAGLISYVIPNLLTFNAIPQIGSGLTSIMFALSPIVTASLALMFRVRPPNGLTLIGIGVGLIGATTIVVAKTSLGETQNSFWIVLALLIPLSLACGNIYRTMAWPEGAGLLQLAAFSNLMAAPMLLAFSLLEKGEIPWREVASNPGLAIAQIAIASAMFSVFFRLQRVGGPTYLSQIGYVAAATGLLFGVAWFGETYPALVWVGAGIIMMGLALSTLGQVKSRTN
jgi:drug/metabolite transporter (DMT)-like permease